MSDELLSQDEIEALLAAANEPAPSAQPTPEQQTEANVEVMAETQAAMESQSEQLGNSEPVVVVQQGSENITSSGNAGSSSYQQEPVIKTVEFAPIETVSQHGVKNGVDLISDVQLQIAVELGRATMKVREVLSLGPGSVVELDKHAGEPVEVVVSNKVIARGEVVVIDENFGVRITEIVNQSQREAHAKAA